MTQSDLKNLAVEQLQTLLRWFSDSPLFAEYREQVRAEIARRS